MPRAIARTVHRLALAGTILAALTLPSQASYFAECAVTADVTAIGPGFVSLTVVSQNAWEGHGQCPIAPGDVYKLEAEVLDGRTGRLDVALSYADGMTPEGVVYSYDWRLAE